MEKLVYSLTIIISGLLAGYVARQLVNRGRLNLPCSLDAIRKWLQNVSLLVLMPVAFLAAVWVAPLDEARILLVPLIGLAALIFGGLLGYSLARLLNYPPRQTGVLFCSSSFTNIGAIGSLVCYQFLGEAGFALVALYKLFEEMYYFSVGYPVTRWLGSESDGRESAALKKMLNVFKDKYFVTITSAFTVGLILNFSGPQRPDLFETVNSIVIPLGTFLLIFSIGLGMRISSVRQHWLPGLYVSIIKSMVVPLVISVAAFWLGLGMVDDGLPLMVVIILSSMPVAFNAIIATSVYDLDVDLANSCWLISTLSLCIVVPWLYWLLSILF